MQAVNRFSQLDYAEKPTLFLEFHGSESGVKEQAEVFGEIAADHGGLGFKWTSNAEERANLWKARHNFFYAMRAQRPGAKGISTGTLTTRPASGTCRFFDT